MPKATPSRHPGGRTASFHRHSSLSKGLIEPSLLNGTKRRRFAHVSVSCVARMHQVPSDRAVLPKRIHGAPARRPCAHSACTALRARRHASHETTRPHATNGMYSLNPQPQAGLRLASSKPPSPAQIRRIDTNRHPSDACAQHAPPLVRVHSPSVEAYCPLLLSRRSTLHIASSMPAVAEPSR